MFQSQNIYIYVPIRTKLRLFTQGTVVQYVCCKQRRSDNQGVIQDFEAGGDKVARLRAAVSGHAPPP